MKWLRYSLEVTAALLLPGALTSAATLHVWQDSPSPNLPYTNWATAAHTIQDAVDAARPFDTVLVTNGVYATGGRPWLGCIPITNRVIITQPVTVRSVHGPERTVIRGYKGPGGVNGSAAVRCVALAFGGRLVGFTLTNGATGNCGGEDDQRGGGVWCTGDGALSNCVVVGNQAETVGGGVYRCSLYNCALVGNTAGSSGGGASHCMLNNCTVTGNSSRDEGGGTAACAMQNSILYHNNAITGPNYHNPQGDVNYCCTKPLPATGIGNMTTEPQLAGPYRLSATSPCRAAGSRAYAKAKDIDGDPWADPPAIGCDEYRVEGLTGPLAVDIEAPFTNVAVGFRAHFTARIGGRPSANRWDFGDGTVVSNRPYTSHVWSAGGEYRVVLWAYNESNPQGVTAAITVKVSGKSHYVWAENPNPVPPYTSWSTAARSIQDAVDFAPAGAVVWATNGVYATGGWPVRGGVTNRVAVTKPLTVRSMNGPDVTFIRGYQVPGTVHGSEAVTCAYLTNGATLVGFTLTNGATGSFTGFGIEDGAGVWCESVGVVLSNCVLTGNAAAGLGGGAHSGTLNNCTIIGNAAAAGGGAVSAILTHCRLIGNSVWADGGGVFLCTLNQCTVVGNSAYSGGGASESTAIHCMIFSNTAAWGGGAYGGSLSNCTLVGNHAGRGGGAAVAGLRNCIVYYNLTGQDAECDGCGLTFTCTTPLFEGLGNITNEPAFVDWEHGDLHLRSGSPCIDAGSNRGATSRTDLDGKPCPLDGNGDGIAKLDMGAYEHRVLFVSANSPAPSPPYTNWATAAHSIQKAVNAAVPGDTVVVTNGVYSTGGRAVVGVMTNRVTIDQAITVKSMNGPADTVITGAAAPGGGNGYAAIRCAYVGTNAALEGFTLTGGHTLTNGDWHKEQSGAGVWCESTGTVSNCVIKSNSARLYGGAAYSGVISSCSIIGNRAGDGGGTYNSRLSRSTLESNRARGYGGGAHGSSLDRCTITGNYSGVRGGGTYSSALTDCNLSKNSSEYGGGASGGTLVGCLLVGNSAGDAGGGTYLAALRNCTLAGNSAYGGGGVWWSTLENCIVYGNTAVSSPNYDELATLSFSCTSPLPTSGYANIDSEPCFVDPASGDFRLRFGSPCIDAGINLSAILTNDLDGNPRSLDGNGDGVAACDMGAYEFDLRTVVPTNWFLRYGLDPSDPDVVSGDPDLDALTTYQEWVADTDPTNSASLLRISAILKGPPVAVSFAGSSNRLYTLFSCTNLSAGSWIPVPGGLTVPGSGALQTLQDTNAVGPGFYRVGVSVP